MTSDRVNTTTNTTNNTESTIAEPAISTLSEGAASVYKRIQTMNRSNNEEYSNMIRELIERIDERETDVLSLRVPKRVKILYSLLSGREKRELKEAIVQFMLGYVQQVRTQSRVINVNRSNKKKLQAPSCSWSLPS